MDARGRKTWPPGQRHADAVTGGRRAARSEPTAWTDPAGGLGGLPVASLLLAADGSAVAINDAWTALSNLGANQSKGEGWLNAVAPLDRGALRARMLLAATAAEAGSADCQLDGPDGLRQSRWWWRPNSNRLLIVCVADISDKAWEADVLSSPAGTHLDAGQRGISMDLAIALIHRIFATGLILESAASSTNDRAAVRIQDAVAELDGIIRDIRLAVFQPPASPGAG